MSRYKPYPAYKDSGVEWLGKVPEGWEVSPFKRHIERNDGGVWGNDPSGTNDTVVIRSTEQTVDGQWIIHQPAIRQLSISEKQSALLEKDDLVVTKSSGSSLHIGKTTLVNKEIANLECCYSNFMQRLRMKPSFLPKLAWYVMNNIISRKQLDLSSNSTTGLANINSEMIGQLLLARPPESEQGHLVNGIDHETSFIDTLIQKNTRLMELLKEKRSALITHAVTKGLDPNVKMKDSGVEWIGEVPEGWEIRPVKHLYNARLGKMVQPQQKSDEEILVPYHRAQTVQWERVDYDQVEQMWANPAEVVTYSLEEGDLLICEGGDVCRAALFNQVKHERVIFQNSIHRVRSVDGNHPEWILRLMQHVRSSEWIDVLCNKNTIVHFTSEKLASLECPHPPPTEQAKILIALRSETASIDALIAKTKLSIDILKERRSAFITAAVTGQIDLREAA